MGEFEAVARMRDVVCQKNAVAEGKFNSLWDDGVAHPGGCRRVGH
jgi:hypothetical protein